MKTKGKITDVYPLSPLQEGMLFHSLYDTDSSAYFVQLSLVLKGKFDREIAEKSYVQLINRHEILRTAFVHEEVKSPVQCVLDQRDISFEFKSLSELNESQQIAYLESVKKEDRQVKFQLNKDVLTRLKLFKLNENAHYILWSFHHVIIDGWCKSILIADFIEIYHSLLENRPANLPVIPKYRSYIDWISKRDRTFSEKYWKNFLENYEVQTPVPLKNSSGEKGEKEFYSQRLEQETTNRLKKIARDNQTTLSNLIQTIWGVLLAKYNGTEDALFGSVVSGRPSEMKGIERMVGLFINTIPFRVNFRNSVSFLQLLRKTHRQFIDNEEHHYYPLSEIQSLSALRNNLFDHILVYESYPDFDQINLFDGKEDEKQQVNSLPFYGIPKAAFTQNHYDFYLIVGTHDSINFKYFYDPNILNLSSVKYLAKSLNSLIEQILDYPEIELSSLLLQEQSHQGNVLEKGSLQKHTIQHSWKEQVKINPYKMAIRYNNRNYTYEEIDKFTDQIAGNLIEFHGVKPGDRCGIYVNKSFFGVCAMLGIIKAGAIFVPLEIKSPTDRLCEVEKDARFKLLLTESDLLFNVSDFYKGEICAVDILSEEVSDRVQFPKYDLNDILYLIYTSGSSGKPKGVLVPNKALANYVQFINTDFDINESDQTILLSSVSYDLGFTSIWSSLLAGATLHLNEELLLNAERLIEYIESNDISYIKATPSFICSVLKSSYIDKLSTSALRLILFGGERLIFDDIKKIQSLSDEILLVNHYGPTEATVGCLTSKLDQNVANQNTTQVIGRPIDNMSVLIVDKNNNILPDGAIGELCVCGVGVSSGYLNSPELTASKFFISNLDNQIYYKTGDKCKKQINGNVEFLGRIDNQVKIRGYRVELEEVKNVLLGNDRISQVAVIEKSGELIAYLHNNQNIQKEEIVKYLKSKVQEYMIPAHIIFLEEFVLNSNGKIDRNSLPLPESISSVKIVSPQNAIEEELLIIWQDVLEKENISVEDDFFALGGHSLKGVQVISRIHKDMNLKLDLKLLFDHTTIVKLADQIEILKMVEKVKNAESNERRSQVII